MRQPVRISFVRAGESPDVRLSSRGGAWIVDRGTFRPLVEMEIHKAQRLRYSISLLCVATNGQADAPHHDAAASPLAERITPLLRSTDALAHWERSALALLLVDAEVMNLPSIVDRLTQRLEILRWSAGGASYPKTTAHPDALFQQAQDLMMQAERDGGNRLYLPS
jgi:hypothetical protein